MNRRALRVVLIAVGLVGFTVYFAFSTFLFSPMEDDYEFDVSTLIPRDVDFFLAKAELNQDFESFPDLVATGELSETPSARAWTETPLYREEIAPRLEELRTSLDEALAQAPIAIDPLDVAGGRDLAVAGYFVGTDLAQARWATYARTNWIGKFALALLDYPGLLNLDAQGLSVVNDEGVVTLSGGQLSAPLSMTRVLDVLVVGSDAQLVRAAHSLNSASGSDSFGQSARYADSIDLPEREGRELEFFVDYLTLAEEFRLTGRWPNAMSEDFAPAFFGRLFQTAALKEIVGLLSFAGGLKLHARGELSSELVTPVQKKLYRARDVDKEEFREVVQFVPLDAGLCVYMRADVGDLMRQALDALDAASLGLVEDQVRAVWGYGTAETLIEDFEKALLNRVAFVVRPNDYPEDPEGPPHDGRPVVAWCLGLWADDVAKLTEIRETVRRHQTKFGLQGPEPGSNGVFTNHAIEGGFTVYEFWSMQVPGTGHIAMSLPVGSGDFFFVGNSFRIVEQMLKTYYDGAPHYPRLKDRPDFQSMVFDGLPAATVQAWANPRSMGASLRDILRDQAELGVQLDDRLERARIERGLLQEQYGGRSASELSPGERSAFDSLVDQEMRNLITRVREEQVPRLFAEYERNVTMSEIVGGALLQLALQPKSFEMGVQVRVEAGER